MNEKNEDEVIKRNYWTGRKRFY